MRRFLLPLFLLVTVFSCFEQGDCSDISSNIMAVNFYNFSDKKAKTITLDSITVTGTRVALYKKQTVGSVKLPLNPIGEVTTYNFYYGTEIASLEVEYKSRSYALAPDCKAIELITLVNGSFTVIKDLKITQADLTSSATENIKIYF